MLHPTVDSSSSRHTLGKINPHTSQGCTHDHSCTHFELGTSLDMYMEVMPSGELMLTNSHCNILIGDGVRTKAHSVCFVHIVI